MIDLPGFETDAFEATGRRRAVYRRGDGPPVLLMHELPGISPEVVRLARWIADAGFSIWMPHLFGTPGRPTTTGYLLRQGVRACLSREFSVLARRRASPIAAWLRALSRDIRDRTGQDRMGVVGLCLTGNFVLTLMVDEHVMAPVTAQPSLPLGLTAAHREALHVTPSDLDRVRTRMREGCPLLALRFEDDRLSPAARMDRLERELGPGVRRIELPSRSVEPTFTAREAHSVLGAHLVDAPDQPTRRAVDQVIAFLTEQLRPVAD